MPQTVVAGQKKTPYKSTMWQLPTEKPHANQRCGNYNRNREGMPQTVVAGQKKTPYKSTMWQLPHE